MTRITTPRSGIAGLALFLAASPLLMAQSSAPSHVSTPAGEEALDLPAETSLGTVRIPVRVMAGGDPLPAGTYRLRLTARTAAPPEAAKATGWAKATG